jgi:acyl dehydratase
LPQFAIGVEYNLTFSTGTVISDLGMNPRPGVHRPRPVELFAGRASKANGIPKEEVMKWSVGDKASLSKTFTADEVQRYAEISTDTNPVHVDPEFARKNTPFDGCIVHGMLVGSLFSALLGMHLPGMGTIYLGQKLSFKGPVPVGEEVTATVEITHIREDKPIITLRTLCVNRKGETVIDGEAVVKAPAA